MRLELYADRLRQRCRRSGRGLRPAVRRPVRRVQHVLQRDVQVRAATPVRVPPSGRKPAERRQCSQLQRDGAYGYLRNRDRRVLTAL